MLSIKAIFSRKENNFEPNDCIIEKVIRLSGAEYDSFARNMLRDQDFIRDNIELMHSDSAGKTHCLLVVGEGRRDGILVDSSGSDYARYSAFIPNAESFLMVEQYPALAELNRKLTDITNYIAEQSGERVAIGLEDIDARFDINLEFNDVLLDTILNMLGERPEIQAVEIDKNEFIIYGSQEIEPPAEDISDPSVTKTDMYAYGYSWDGMIPLGKERALQLFDEGHGVFRLYNNDVEGAIDNREEFEEFDGLFGVEDPSWDETANTISSIEVFILNRERYEKGEASGEWLSLPTDADTLRGLFERIGIDRPSEGTFTITTVRVPQDYIRDYITKYDNLDELNMLASFLSDMEDFEHDKMQAVLTSGVQHIGSGPAALINMLYDDNFQMFDLINAANAEELGRYWEAEDPISFPEGVSHEEYGRQAVAEEKGKFTELGYIYFRNKELSQEYTGVVPDEYKIVGEALLGLRSKTQERGGQDEKPSVVDRIRASRTAPRKPKSKDGQINKKSKGGEEL